MLVGVSRQSVTKWEAERAYPEMDKLLKLCQIFDCSLDDLVSGDLTAREEDVAAPEVPAGPPLTSAATTNIRAASPSASPPVSPCSFLPLRRRRSWLRSLA